MLMPAGAVKNDHADTPHTAARIDRRRATDMPRFADRTSMQQPLQEHSHDAGGDLGHLKRMLDELPIGAGW